MKINYLSQEYVSSSLLSISSFLIKFSQKGDVWLFNCFESCQHILSIKKIKISQIKKIIITDNSIDYISGLLGLLSSISLNTTTERIDLFGPNGLQYYLFGGRKYSQTNFRYKLYIHDLSHELIFNQSSISCTTFYHIYINGLDNYNYIILSLERSGPFNSLKAFNYSIPFGPLYGDLKLGKQFILPDGFIVCNKKFVCGYFLGHRVTLFDRIIENKIA